MMAFSSGVMRYFYPRPPRGGRRSSRLMRSPSTSYFYPRPPRGGRPYPVRTCFAGIMISIHALREEGDGVSEEG